LKKLNKCAVTSPEQNHPRQGKTVPVGGKNYQRKYGKKNAGRTRETPRMTKLQKPLLEKKKRKKKILDAKSQSDTPRAWLTRKIVVSHNKKGGSKICSPRQQGCHEPAF